MYFLSRFSSNDLPIVVGAAGPLRPISTVWFWVSFLEAQPAVCFFSSATDSVNLVPLQPGIRGVRLSTSECVHMSRSIAVKIQWSKMY